MISVNIRVPEKLLNPIDKWVREGRFASRSEAIKTIISFYEEREKTKHFASMLVSRSREARKKAEILVPLE